MIRRNIPACLFLLSALCCIFIWYAVYYYEIPRDLAIHFFDVGQGDSIFIELPNHRQVLIDGGPGNAVLAKLGSVMPFWDHTIDLVILTHPHADHVDGLIEVLKRYDVGMVLESGAWYSTPDHDEWRRLLQEKNIRVAAAIAGKQILLSKESGFDIVYPFRDLVGARLNNIHDSMVVVHFFYGLTRILFMGDAERPVEYQLIGVDKPLGADILKVGHHGSKTSTTQALLDAVHPQAAIISVGRKNNYGHPYGDVVDRIKAAGITLFRTDSDGDILATSNGKTFFITKEK